MTGSRITEVAITLTRERVLRRAGGLVRRGGESPDSRLRVADHGRCRWGRLVGTGSH